MKKELYPRGIELVTSAIIRRRYDDKILLSRSPKWSNKWTLPGGHIEPGETFFESLEREVTEETGISAKALKIISCGELIGSKDFHRLAHFVYVDILAETDDSEATLDQNELTESGWFTVEEALNLELAESFQETLETYRKTLL